MNTFCPRCRWHWTGPEPACGHCGAVLLGPSQPTIEECKAASSPHAAWRANHELSVVREFYPTMTEAQCDGMLDEIPGWKTHDTLRTVLRAMVERGIKPKLPKSKPLAVRRRKTRYRDAVGI